jgi:starch phosphorylase
LLYSFYAFNYVNGVAKKHETIFREMFPSYEIHAITNGVHSYTWTCATSLKNLNPLGGEQLRLEL